MSGSGSVKLRDMRVHLIGNVDLIVVKLISIQFGAIVRLMVDLTVSYLVDGL